jgi:hypothetical protein
MASDPGGPNETSIKIPELLGRLYSNLMSLETALRLSVSRSRGEDQTVFFRRSVNDVVPATHPAVSPPTMAGVIAEFEKEFVAEFPAHFSSVPRKLLWDCKEIRNMLFHAHLFQDFDSPERYLVRFSDVDQANKTAPRTVKNKIVVTTEWCAEAVDHSFIAGLLVERVTSYAIRSRPLPALPEQPAPRYALAFEASGRGAAHPLAVGNLQIKFGLT